jgi:excisionase family DNA binding protein
MKTDADWLSLRDAAKLLGVHPGTVRSWADKSLLPVYRTRGGHRRFKRNEVELWASTSRGAAAIDPASVVQAAVRHIRLKISEGRLEAEPWYQKLDEEARRQYRESAQSLFRGLVNYLSSGGEDGVSEARSMGTSMRRGAPFRKKAWRGAGLPLFRDALAAIRDRGSRWRTCLAGSGDVCNKSFTDLASNLLETYEGLEKAGGK